MNRAEKAKKLLELLSANKPQDFKDDSFEDRRDAHIQLQFLAYDEAIEKGIFTREEWMSEFQRFSNPITGFNEALQLLALCLWAGKIRFAASKKVYAQRSTLLKRFSGKDVEVILAEA